ncbi:uncharacterized protein LOC132270042 [Cornus florida]|uniref:uncharacterized protein LOC132270042 n=1 Tax=Cornus florida TaxID=4283 RepID=UPI0028A2C1A0|nr:uncharacterized protein LOC132270042 [Cornus florida]
MNFRPPVKLLQLSVISAQDLAPVSKQLRTYAVAWVYPDRKFTTRVDRLGHNNPTWNDKFTFPVDDRFLSSDIAVVTIDIYSVSWLRDIPIGSVRILVNDLIPPPSWFKNNSATRVVPLQVTRPSGVLQGTLNVGVNLLDSRMRSMPLSSSSFGHEDRKSLLERDEMFGQREQLWRSLSDQTMSVIEDYVTREESLSNGSTRTGSDFGVRENVRSKTGSVCSYIRPLPSEVAAELHKGLYATRGNEVGSSVLDDWTMGGESEKGGKPEIVQWTTDYVPLKSNRERERSRRRSGGGLLSCFGIACGYECNLFCGKPSKKKNKKKKFGT